LAPGAPQVKPIIEKKEKIETGEEGETTHATAGGKLFCFDSKEKAWKEKGSGVAKVNSNKDGKARLIMRADVTHRVLLNAQIGSFTAANRTSDKPKAVFFRVIEKIGEKPAPVQYSLRCMDEEAAKALEKALKAQQEKKD